MKYIKHDGNYYQKVELKKLSKEELIDLITEAIEVKNKTIHEHHYDVFYTTPLRKQYVTCTYTNGINSIGPNYSTLTGSNTDTLVNLATSIME